MRFCGAAASRGSGSWRMRTSSGSGKISAICSNGTRAGSPGKWRSVRMSWLHSKAQPLRPHHHRPDCHESVCSYIEYSENRLGTTASLIDLWEWGHGMICVRHLTKRFGAFTAVDSISFEVDAGEIF